MKIYNINLIKDFGGIKIVNKFNYFLDYFKVLKNPFSALLFKFGFKKSITLKFKISDKIITLNKSSVLDNLMGIIYYNKNISDELINFINELNSDNPVISWAGANIYNYTEVDLSGAHVVFFEYFNRGYWSDFKDKTVIDIGSHIGDSGLYFASQGAEVYAFEPVRYLYDYSLKIKELNPEIQDKLHFHNFGVSDRRGSLSISDMDSTSEYLHNEDSYNVDIITIEDIFNKFEISADILKMDCEGCEFNIILNQDLSMFNHIIFEHHSKIVQKDYKILLDKLKSQGFKFKKIGYEGSEFDEMGLIHAFK